MKKILAMTFAVLMIFSCNVFAANSKQTVGVVIVSGAEFKTADFYKIVQQNLKFKGTSKVGDEMQSKYQKFLLENDLITEKVPRKQYLLDFTAQSGCDKILFLVIDSTADHQNNPNTRQKNRMSVQVDAYLCDKYRILEGGTSAQESKSKTSDFRARREAFKKCLSEIAKFINL